jgi:GTP-binding protein HflX
VDEVLTELGAADKPHVTALNKIDLLPDASVVDTSLYENAVAISAVAHANLEALLRRVGEVLAAGMLRVRVVVPFERGDLVEVFHRRGHVTEQQTLEEGTCLEGLLPQALMAAFAPYRQPAPLRRGPRRSRFQSSQAHAAPGAPLAAAEAES